MKRLAPTLGLLGLLVTALVASAAPDDVLDPAAGRRFGAVGDVRVVKLHEQLTQKLERAIEGAPGADSLETKETLDADFREEVLGGAPGRPTRVKVTVSAFTFSAGGKADTSLRGRVVLIDPVARTWALERPDPAPTGAARRFLDRLARRLAPQGEVAAIESAFLPTKPARTGETWPAARALESLLPGAPFTEADPARGQVTARADRLSPAPSVVLEGVLRLLTVPGTPDRFTRGGELRVRGAATWSAGLRPGDGAVELTQQVEGAAEGQLPEGTPYRTTISLTHTLRMEARQR